MLDSLSTMVSVSVSRAVSMSSWNHLLRWRAHRSREVSWGESGGGREEGKEGARKDGGRERGREGGRKDGGREGRTEREGGRNRMIEALLNSHSIPTWYLKSSFLKTGLEGSGVCIFCSAALNLYSSWLQNRDCRKVAESISLTRRLVNLGSDSTSSFGIIFGVPSFFLCSNTRA